MGYFDDSKKREEWEKELAGLTRQREQRLSGEGSVAEPEPLPVQPENKAAALREPITLEELMREADISRPVKFSGASGGPAAQLDRTLGMR